MLLKQINEDAQCDQETKAQNEYLRKEPSAFLKQKQKVNKEPLQTEARRHKRVFSHNIDSSSEDEPLRMAGLEPRIQANSNYFKIEIAECEGKIDPKEFLDWLHTAERVFEYKDVSEDKKVKLLALRLRKYTSLWWANMCAKRVRERKSKIKT